MNARSKTARLFLIVLTTICVLWRPARAAEVNVKINAKAFGQQTSPTTTEGETIGGGLLNGTTAGNFSLTGFDFPLAFLAGTVTFTTKSATLTVTGTGELNVLTGVFSFTGSVTAATGKLAGATGSLTFDGVQDLNDGSFVQDITGEITVNLAP